MENFIRTLIFFCCLVSTAVHGYAWMWLIDCSGACNFYINDTDVLAIVTLISFVGTLGGFFAMIGEFGFFLTFLCVIFEACV